MDSGEASSNSLVPWKGSAPQQSKRSNKDIETEKLLIKAYEQMIKYENAFATTSEKIVRASWFKCLNKVNDKMAELRRSLPGDHPLHINAFSDNMTINGKRWSEIKKTMCKDNYQKQSFFTSLDKSQ